MTSSTRRWPAVLLAALLLPACSDGGSSGGPDGSPGGGDPRPNIVYIVADDLGYADLGAQGSSEAKTPFIDSIAANGIRFTNGYVSGPVCSPTRAGLMTGRYQQRFGHEFNGTNPLPPGFGLPLTEITLAERLRAAGYATGIVGKWHLGMEPAFHPMNRGFDEFFGFLGGSHSYTSWDGDAANPILRGFTPVVETLYLTEAFGREAVSFIDRRRGAPFFLYLPFNAVHTPLQAPARYTDRFPGVTDPDRKEYLGMLAAMDDAVGAVLDALRAAGLEERTLVVFHSDNGGPTGVNASANTPLRGDKGTLREGGIRVPFLAQWKGRFPAGEVDSRPVISLDLFPTFLAAAGGSVPVDRVIDGVNLLPYLDGTISADPHAALCWRFGAPAAIRKGDWKLFKYGSNASQLFDLAADVGESNNLAASNPAKVAELESDLAAWKSELVAPLW